jgi:hypothetical protein
MKIINLKIYKILKKINFLKNYTENSKIKYHLNIV